jgi:Uncharacterized small protein
MTAVHNSGDIDAKRGAPGVSGRPATGLPELCTRGGAALLLAARAVRRGAGAVRWYMSQLMGDSAYETYVAHQRRTHPDAEVLTERQFWRQKMDDQDRNPGARCC